MLPYLLYYFFVITFVWSTSNHSVCCTFSACFSRPCSFLVVSVIFGITIWHSSSLNLFSTMMCAQYSGGFELQRSIYQPLRLPFCFVEATCVFLSHRYSNTLLLLWQSGSQRERISLIRHGFVWVLRLEAPCCCNQGSDAVPAVQYFWLWFILVKRKQKIKENGGEGRVEYPSVLFLWQIFPDTLWFGLWLFVHGQ